MVQLRIQSDWDIREKNLTRRHSMALFRITSILLAVLMVSMLSFCSKKLTEEEMFTKAESLMNGGEFNEAVTVYEKLIDTFPESENRSKAVFMLGFLYANELNEPAQGGNYYRMMLEEYPDHELAVSAKFELDNLGKNSAEIDSILVARIQEQQKLIEKNETKR